MSTLFDMANMALPQGDNPPHTEAAKVLEADSSDLSGAPSPFSDLEALLKANNFKQLPSACTDDLAHRFLQAGAENGCLTHGFIFKGNETNQLYASALILAKLLNCQQPSEPGTACGKCTPCRWIEQNSHPAVMTLSRLSMWDEDALKKIRERKKPLTKIVVSQVNELIRRLSMSSDAHRVVIISDMSLTQRPEDEPLNPLASHEMAENLGILPGDHQLHFNTLTRSVFDDSATNKLLKTLEEPTGHTTFIFLAQQDEQLIDTIVSRCQVLPFATLGNTKTPLSDAALYDYVIEAMSKLEAGRHQGAITADHGYTLIHERLMAEWGCEPDQVIKALMAGVQQVFVRQGLDANPIDTERYETGVALLTRLTDAERQLASHVNPDGVLSRLRYDLAEILTPSKPTV